MVSLGTKGVNCGVCWSGWEGKYLPAIIASRVSSRREAVVEAPGSSSAIALKNHDMMSFGSRDESSDWRDLNISKKWL